MTRNLHLAATTVTFLLLLTLPPPASAQQIGPIEHASIRLSIPTPNDVAEQGAPMTINGEVTFSCAAPTNFIGPVEIELFVHSQEPVQDLLIEPAIQEVDLPAGACHATSFQADLPFQISFIPEDETTAFDVNLLDIQAEVTPFQETTRLDVMWRNGQYAQVEVEEPPEPSIARSDPALIPICVHTLSNGPLNVRLSLAETDNVDGLIMMPSPGFIEPNPGANMPQQTCYAIDYLASDRFADTDRFAVYVAVVAADDSRLTFLQERVPMTVHLTGEINDDDQGGVYEAPAHPMLLGPLMLAAIAGLLRRRDSGRP